MAKQKGIIRIKGSIGGITFYQRNGENLSREQNGPDKNKMKNDPNFARTRENNQEFGGSATIGKALRMGLVQEFDEMADVSTTGRITKLMKQIISRDMTGVRGQRGFAPVLFKSMFVNFQFSERNPFDSIFLAPFTAVPNAGRTEVTITVPPFNSGNMVHAPSGATHFRIINLISTLSQFNFNILTKKYDPTDGPNNSKNAFNASAYIQVGSTVAAPTTIVSTITPPPTLLATTVLISCIGVEFYQQIGTQYYLLSSNNAMKIQAAY
jgi:hypothetical protein